MKTIKKFRPIRVRIINQTRDPVKHNNQSIKRRIILESGYRNFPRSIRILSYRTRRVKYSTQESQFFSIITNPYVIALCLVIIFLLISRS